MLNQPTLWRIDNATVVYNGGPTRILHSAVRIPEVLKAFDQGRLEAFLRDTTTAEMEGTRWIMDKRDLWQGPVSAGMMSAGKGVDTFRSTADRNIEFAIGGIAASANESPYDWIYNGGRDLSLLRSPELFLKVVGQLITGPGGKIGRRKLAKTVKPEAEFTAVLAPETLNLVGWTIGNDQTINEGGNDGTNIVPGEAENTLLLPQAKVFRHCCGIGPCIVLSKFYPGGDVCLTVRILRNGSLICEQSMKYGDYVRDSSSVIKGWLQPAWEDLFAPEGGFLMLGTGTRIPNEASVLAGDTIEMECAEMFPASFVQDVVEVP